MAAFLAAMLPVVLAACGEDDLTPEQLVHLEGHGRIRDYAAKSPIYLPHEPANEVFVLFDGLAKVSHLTKDGKESILAFIEPGDLFGERAVFHVGSREEYVEAIEPVRAILFPVEVLRRLVESRGDIALSLMQLMSDRRHRIENRLKNILFLSNRERLVHLLLELSEQFGVQHPDGIRLRIKLSHQELANLIGSTRETVTVLLGQLKAEGLVAGGRQRIIVKDESKLRAEIEAGS